MFQLTEEERQQCRVYKQQAIEVEKKLREKRLLKERQLEEPVWEESSQCEDENSSSAEMEVLEFIRKALGDSNDLEEVKLLISEVGEELQKRRSIGSRDSTSNDVDSISLNYSTDPSNLDIGANYFDNQNMDESVTFASHPNLQLVPKTFNVEHEGYISEPNAAEENPQVISKPEEPVPSEFSRNVSQLPIDEITSEVSINTNQLRFDGYPESYEAESSKIDYSNLYRENVSPARSCRSDEITPPKLIRSNSYTLDSPSPSVLMYLRSLALENSSEKVEVSSKVIKNLNNCWKDEEPEESKSLNAFSELKNGVGDVGSDYSDDEETNDRELISNKLSHLKIPDEQNGYMTHFNNKASPLKIQDAYNEIDEEKVVRNVFLP